MRKENNKFNFYDTNTVITDRYVWKDLKTCKLFINIIDRNKISIYYNE